MMPRLIAPYPLKGSGVDGMEGGDSPFLSPTSQEWFPMFTQSLNLNWWRRCLREAPVRNVSWGFILILLILGCVATTSAIIQEHKPNVVITSDELASQSFHGNHSHVDYFRLLQRDGNSLLIGARNYVYNISTRDLSEHIDKRIEWISKKTDSDNCFNKGKSEAECHNYIRVLAKKYEGRFLVCGTNAYKPTCRDYNLMENGSFSFEESSGVGKSPFDPRHNSTFVFAEGHLYSGTVVDFQGMKPLIFRDPLKTDQSDYRQLNGPDFVHSFEYGDYVFFFFREIAVEYMNCGKRVYSRVARVCKGDRGVEKQRASWMSTWTSFLKSRLNCSFPGDYPFYFDEIQSVSDVVLGVYGGANDEVIYAIFTTPQNSIPGSAVCAFSMRNILDTFEGPFKEQKDLNSNWMPVLKSRVPEPRPGSCVNDSRTLNAETVNFVKAHPLMDELVSPFMGKPLIMKASFRYRFTKLTVDPQVQIPSGDFVDIVFIATDIGMILKVINSPAEAIERLDVAKGLACAKELVSCGSPLPSGTSVLGRAIQDGEVTGQVSPVIIEEIYAFEPPVSINNLQIAKESGGDSKLIVITDTEVKAIPLERCSRAVSCRECVKLQDPYCGWYPNEGLCGSIQKLGEHNVLQNISSGTHHLCLDNYEISNDKSSSSSPVYATETSQPPVEADTCPPCVCAEQSTSPIPSSTSSPNVQPSHVSGGQEMIELVTAAEGILQENDMDALPAHIPQRETNYITNSIPIIPNVSRGGPHSAKGVGKEYAPPLRGGVRPLQRELNEVAIAYSEGVTGPVVGASLGGPLIYSSETMAIAVTTATVAALVIGFISGFLFSRKCRGDDYPHFSETPYLDSKLNKCENTADPNMYTANNTTIHPPKQINNLVTNYNPKNINTGKSNTNTTTDTKLIKPAKCAYI